MTRKIRAIALCLMLLGIHQAVQAPQALSQKETPKADRSQAGTAASATAKATSDKATSNQRARAMLTQMYAAYRDLRSFSCDVKYDITTIVWNGSKAERRFISCSTQYVIRKPDRFVYTLTTDHGIRETVFGDGQVVSMTTTDPKAMPLAYVRVPFGSGFDDMNAIRAVYLSRLRPAERAARLVPEAIFGVDLYPVNSDLWQVYPSAKLEGEDVDVVGYSLPLTGSKSAMDWARQRWTLFLSRRDHLLRQVRIEYLYANGMANTSVETYRNVSVNPTLDDSRFIFPDKSGFVAVPDVAGLYKTPEPAAADKPDPARVKRGAIPGSAPAPFTVNDLDGKPVTLSDYRGKVVLLDFWATWCAPCLREIPALVSVYQKYHGQGLEMIGFAVDRDASLVKRFARDKQMNWLMVLNDVTHQDVANKGYVPDGAGIPYTVLIGRDGKVAASGRMSREVLVQQIEAAIAIPAGGNTVPAGK